MSGNKQRLIACLLALGVVSTSVHAENSAPTGSDMFVDLVISRPLGLLGIIAGSAAFVVALPFTVPSGSVARSAEELVKKPVRYTFKRPLGEFPDDH